MDSRPNKTETMRCAIYARYSTDSQNPKSIDDQITECRAFIERRRWTVADEHIFTDYAVSGAVTDREGYDALKRAAVRRNFDYIVVDDLSRLGRDAGEAIRIFQELQLIGVHIVGIADGIDSGSGAAKLPFYMKSIMNEMFLDDLKAKVVRGLKGQVIRGYSAGGRVYGYDREPEYYADGQEDKFGRPKRYGVRIRVNQGRAGVVRQVFELFNSGVGYRSIASQLNAERIPSPHAGCGSRKGHWSRGAIRAILLQEKYIGDWSWNKTRWNKKNASGKRIRRDNPRDTWVDHFSEELAIIPQTLWDAVQLRLRSRKNPREAGKGRGQYVLSGFLKCAECGSSLIVTNSKAYSGYICNGYRSGGSAVCSCNHRLPRVKAESGVYSELVRILED